MLGGIRKNKPTMSYKISNESLQKILELEKQREFDRNVDANRSLTVQQQLNREKFKRGLK